MSKTCFLRTDILTDQNYSSEPHGTKRSHGENLTCVKFTYIILVLIRLTFKDFKVDLKIFF